LPTCRAHAARTLNDGAQKPLSPCRFLERVQKCRSRCGENNRKTNRVRPQPTQTEPDDLLASRIDWASTQDIGGFDGDGIDAYGAPTNPTDLAGCGGGIAASNCNYGGGDAFFTNNNSPYMSLTVNFLWGGIAAGGTGYFSLEEAVSLSAPPVITPGTPEASTWAMMLLGFAGLGFAGYRKARAVKALSAA